MWTNTEIIDLCRKNVENAIKFQLSSKNYHFLLKRLEKFPDTNTRIEFIDSEFVWDNESQKTKITDEYFSTNHYIPFSASGKLKYLDNNGNKQLIEHSFRLYANMWFHFDSEKPVYSFDIYDSAKNKLREYNQQIWEINEIEGLYSIMEEQNRFDNKNSAQFFTDITRLDKNKPVPFNDFEVHDDIVMCHQDIVFAIGELYAYRPYITDFTSNPVNVNGDTIYQYFPSFFDKRYLSTCGRMLELLYNIWDKIGDILAPYFTPKISPNRVYFGKVIEKSNNAFQNNDHYNWLLNFK